MALFILQEGIQPIGDFNVQAASFAYVKGGELMTLDVETANNYLSAMDVSDAYASSTGQVPCVRIAYKTTETYKVFYLSDEGTTHYGVMFGTIVGSPVGIGTSFSSGLINTAGTNLGPSTMTGSGKCTVWDKAGMYAVSLDAADQTMLGILPTELNDTPLPGTTLFRSNGNAVATGGRLTITGQNASSDAVAAFVELTDDGVLVITSPRLVGATATYDRMKIQYFGATSGRTS